MSGIDRNYESDTDKLLRKLEKDLPLSDSQKKEIEKHEKIFEKRDEKQPEGEDRLKDF